MHARQNIVISGGTGSGKTTLLNVLSSFIPDDERIVTIEDAAELQLPQEHVVSLETRPPNIEGEGAITIRDLVRNALRMRPDRIVVGECRGGEALDMLQAMNTGHDGSLTTLHANTPARRAQPPRDAGADGRPRPAGAGDPRADRRRRCNLIVQQSRLQDGTRRITYITEISGQEGALFMTARHLPCSSRPAWRPTARCMGQFVPTGHVPAFVEEPAQLRHPGAGGDLPPPDGVSDDARQVPRARARRGGRLPRRRRPVRRRRRCGGARRRTYGPWIVDEFDAMFEEITIERAQAFITGRRSSAPARSASSSATRSPARLLRSSCRARGYFLPRFVVPGARPRASTASTISWSTRCG